MQDTAIKVPLTGNVPNTDRTIGLKKSDIRRLKKHSLVNAQGYFYLAILCSYGQGATSIDRDWFCEEWDIDDENFDVLLAQLQKKGIVA